MNNDVSERLAMVRIAGLLAVSMSLGGCSAGSSSIAAWLNQDIPEVACHCRGAGGRSRPRHRRRA